MHSLLLRLSSQKSNQLHPILGVIRNNHVSSSQLYRLSNYKNHYHDVVMKANFSSAMQSHHHDHDHETNVTNTSTTYETKQNPEIENPLSTLKSISQKFHKCDEDGFRKKNCHWTFALSIVDPDESKNLEMKKVSSIVYILCD